MKKGVLLNAEVSAVVSRLGHTDQIVICDAGLPIPAVTQRIDLALTQGVPTFLQVVGVVTQEMQVESAILAEEMVNQNPQLHQALLAQLIQLGQHQGNTISVSYISHQAFKAQTEHSRAVIRSGECSPYANVILCAGVTF
ncbi:D-ribose pyranase [Serratia plymuthica]|jgi:D-ribose pyranase|uniref:D-ribose pyranase n=2 Tax=Serratia plymuthica TaxID=82996 RepID=A0A2X4Y5P7_SERPL|nr:D-ribose pyranase [Serratia plymuthica]AGO57636.1 D-ribose pyranase RbsD [Serratia plymuthica 4Rx13]AGP46659.1 D-ribose pyranase [Serratia plymuthica S13]AHY05010.1 D-ribose pyranase [Serratia plymuthica]ANJ93496.1 D-ribose pyranase [Serratia plymuthica]ANJ96444.1 D-ribose pyranase [Serratia plymuthica]